MFSVIIPLYNKAPYIIRALESVFGQTFLDFEVIVINDGSKDGGEVLVQKKFGDKIFLINLDNSGVSVARNTGIQVSKGDYIAFLDADDFWHLDFLKWIAEGINSFKNIGIIGSSYSVNSLGNVRINPEISRISDYFRVADFNTLFTSSSTVIRKDFFINNKGFKEHLTKGEDLDVWFRAISWFGEAYYVNAPLMVYDTTASASFMKTPSFRKTVFSELFSEDYLPRKSPFWEIFKVKFLLLNAWMFFEEPNNRNEIKKVINQSGKDYLLARIPYQFFGKVIPEVTKSQTLIDGLRKYLKFCFRYIYSR